MRVCRSGTIRLVLQLLFLRGFPLLLYGEQFGALFPFVLSVPVDLFMRREGTTFRSLIVGDHFGAVVCLVNDFFREDAMRVSGPSCRRRATNGRPSGQGSFGEVLLTRLPLPFTLLDSHGHVFYRIRRVLPQNFCVYPPTLQCLAACLACQRPRLLYRRVGDEPLLLGVVALFGCKVRLPNPAMRRGGGRRGHEGRRGSCVLSGQCGEEGRSDFGGLSFLLVRPNFFQGGELRPCVCQALTSIHHEASVCDPICVFPFRFLLCRPHRRVW